MVDFHTLYKLTKDLHVLYVEDDRGMLEEMIELLRSYFADITFAEDGELGLQEYLKFYKQNNSYYDIVIADISMPKMNGVEMSREILEINKDQHIIIISAHNESDYLLDLINMGISHFLTKPLQTNKLKDVFYKNAKAIHNCKLASAYHENIKSLNTELEEKVKEQTKSLRQRIYFDSMTGLSNRVALFEDLEAADIPILFLIDIDKLIVVNELYGTEGGNHVIKEFVAFLKEFAQENSYKVYRLSGDEFILADFVNFIDMDRYEHDLNKLFELLKGFNINYHNNIITIDVTIGVSIAQVNSVENADIALRYAKENGKPYMVYSNMINTKEEKRKALKWKDEIKCAINEGRIVPVYQGIVNRHGEIVKYETLMRMQEKNSKKLISPYCFLDTAIKTKQYVALSRIIILQALEDVKNTDKDITINFAYSDIMNYYFINELENILASKSIGHRLIFELVESEHIRDYYELKEFIKRFRRYDVRIAIDDFGSGFSNFEHILEIRPDYLKIDGSLIKKIDKDPDSLVLVKAIIGFSHDLGIKVIAEFVSTEAIYDILRELDTDEYQGFYFCEPNIGFQDSIKGIPKN